MSLREKCPYSEFFWSVFSGIPTEYGKLFNSEDPNYLFKLILSSGSGYVTTNMHNIPFLKTRHTFFRNFFFPSTITEWHKLDHNIRNSSSFNFFQ